MNTVNSNIYGLGDFSFVNLNFFTKYCLILFMIIGRLELLTILILIKKFLLLKASVLPSPKNVEKTMMLHVSSGPFWFKVVQFITTLVLS